MLRWFVIGARDARGYAIPNIGPMRRRRLPKGVSGRLMLLDADVVDNAYPLPASYPTRRAPR